MGSLEDIFNQKETQSDNIQEIEDLKAQILQLEKLFAECSKRSKFEYLNWEKQEPEPIVPLGIEICERHIDLGTDSSNLFLEGDNIHSMQWLLKSKYAGQIALVWSDVPYNTRDDASLTYDDCREITDWLNFVYYRTRLQHELLSDSGVAIHHIDDDVKTGVMDRYKIILDEIYGKENFVGRFPWLKRGQNKGLVPSKFEYILVYTKDIEQYKRKFPEAPFFRELEDRKAALVFFMELKDQFDTLDALQAAWRKGTKEREEFSEIGKRYTNVDSRGPWWGETESMYSKGRAFDLLLPEGKIVRFGQNGISAQHSKNKLEKEIEDGRFFIQKMETDEKGNVIAFEYKIKKYLDEQLVTKVTTDMWFDPMTREGGYELKKLFDGCKPFSFPKPTKIIRSCLPWTASKEGDIVLIPFGGSGIEAHAIIEESIKSGVRRDFIICQIAEPYPLASDIPNNEAGKTIRCAVECGHTNIADTTYDTIKRSYSNSIPQNSSILEFESTLSNLVYIKIVTEPSFVLLEQCSDFAPRVWKDICLKHGVYGASFNEEAEVQSTSNIMYIQNVTQNGIDYIAKKIDHDLTTMYLIYAESRKILEERFANSNILVKDVLNIIESYDPALYYRWF